MTAIVSPHVCCNDGIITDLSGYGCIPGNLGLGEKFSPLSLYGRESDGSAKINTPSGAVSLSFS
ncbi:hypothetical protein, partial [Morganella morganii]|uniref:hypothetical protein n=1 Tax=Morganella morganii TaxID=582 RepID=UPI00301D5449